MTNGIKHLLMSLFAICTSSLKCLFRYFAHVLVVFVLEREGESESGGEGQKVRERILSRLHWQGLIS